MPRPLWRSREPGLGRRRPMGIAGYLLAALAGIGWGAGRAAARGPEPSPGTSHVVRAGQMGTDPSPTVPAELYERRIRPMLAKNCYDCHGRDKTSGLDLRTREGMLRGGSRGPALVPGDPEASRLYRYAAHLEKPAMPPGDRLAAGDVAALKDWIAAGAPAGTGS